MPLSEKINAGFWQLLRECIERKWHTLNQLFECWMKRFDMLLEMFVHKKTLLHILISA